MPNFGDNRLFNFYLVPLFVINYQKAFISCICIWLIVKLWLQMISLHILRHYEMQSPITAIYSLLETASNLSDFLFRFHFHGLSNFPIENLLFLSAGGVLVPLPRLLVRNADPFCFLAEKKEELLNAFIFNLNPISTFLNTILHYSFLYSQFNAQQSKITPPFPQMVQTKAINNNK